MSKFAGLYYFQDDSGIDAISARIVRMTASKSGRTLRYANRKFERIGSGYKTNHIDLDTGHEVWISRPRKDGNDALYATEVHIDDDVRSAYWCDIRNMPERRSQSSYRSRGKHRVGRNDLKNKTGNI